MENRLINGYVHILILFIFSFTIHGSHAQSSSVEHIMTLDSTMLSFTIKFENLETDTLHSILIVDTLSNELDIASFELGVSSHHYDFFFLDKNVVCWYIYNVRIPGIADEKHNHGFVKYHIKYNKTNPWNKLVANRPSIYYNYEMDYSIDVDDIATLENHEFIGVETKANVKVQVIKVKDEMIIKGEKEFEDEQVYLEVFDDNGTIEFFAKMNKRDGLKLNTSFLKSGNHYLDVYDNHHHEVVKRFTK